MIISLFYAVWYIKDFHIFFDWPGGSVWSNMVAWVICGGLAGAWGMKKYLKHEQRLHNEKMEQAEIHHKALMKKLDDHHDKLHQLYTKEILKQSNKDVRE